MKNKMKNPAIQNIRDKEDKNISRALRTETLKLAIGAGATTENAISAAKQMYDFIEFGLIPNKIEIVGKDA